MDMFDDAAGLEQEVSELTACYHPHDRGRMNWLLAHEAPRLARALRESHSVLLWEAEESAASLHAESPGGVSILALRAQAAAIERCSSLQHLQAELMYEVAGIVERNSDPHY